MWVIVLLHGPSLPFEAASVIIPILQMCGEVSHWPQVSFAVESTFLTVGMCRLPGSAWECAQHKAAGFSSSQDPWA